MTFRRLVATAVACVPLALPALSLAAPPNDAFIAGYASAVLERELSIKADAVRVEGGHIFVTRPPLSPEEKAQLLKVLSVVPGVTGVTVEQDNGPKTATPAEPIERLDVNAAATATTRPTPPDGSPAATLTGAAAGVGVSAAARASAANATPVAATATTVDRADDAPLMLFLGAGRTFAPLLADPRWPHFYASYHGYTRDEANTDLGSVGSVGFGETISLVRQSFPGGFRWEAGIQAGLFATFDLDSDSADLINADYFVGPYAAFRHGNFSVLARLYHQSSHLGDEYILRGPGEAEERINYSYETLHLLASYDLPHGFRVYGGGGYRFDIDPDGVDPWVFQYGAEWISPDTVFGTNWLRPVAAVDLQHQEENGYDLDLSLRAGFQLEDPARFTQRVQILFEYYDGHSPNGQFFDERIRFFGIGAHFYF